MSAESYRLGKWSDEHFRKKNSILYQRVSELSLIRLNKILFFVEETESFTIKKIADNKMEMRGYTADNCQR
jgi:hypothetical protein